MPTLNSDMKQNDTTTALSSQTGTRPASPFGFFVLAWLFTLPLATGAFLYFLQRVVLWQVALAMGAVTFLNAWFLTLIHLRRSGTARAAQAPGDAGAGQDAAGVADLAAVAGSHGPDSSPGMASASDTGATQVASGRADHAPSTAAAPTGTVARVLPWLAMDSFLPVPRVAGPAGSLVYAGDLATGPLRCQCRISAAPAGPLAWCTWQEYRPGCFLLARAEIAGAGATDACLAPVVATLYDDWVDKYLRAEEKAAQKGSPAQHPPLLTLLLHLNTRLMARKLRDYKVDFQVCRVDTLASSAHVAVAGAAQPGFLARGASAWDIPLGGEPAPALGLAPVPASGNEAYRVDRYDLAPGDLMVLGHPWAPGAGPSPAPLTMEDILAGMEPGPCAVLLFGLPG